MASLLVHFVVLTCALTLSACAVLPDGLLDEFIKIRKNFTKETLDSYNDKLVEVMQKANFKIPVRIYNSEQIANLPESFDPKDKWPYCDSLSEIRDQGACGSCWAFGAVAAMTDRYCIHSEGKLNFHVSAEDLVSCCSICGFGCHGGSSLMAWMYWVTTGIVSGGNYNSSQGCRPYSIPLCEHYVPGPLPNCRTYIESSPKCTETCVSSYTIDYEKDKRYGKNIYTVAPHEDQIKAELFYSGPIQAHFNVYLDFLEYQHGVYEYTEGDMIGTHTIKLLGWGVEDGKKYWFAASSWNTEWGIKGFFKILRGVNHCGIESHIITGLPSI